VKIVCAADCGIDRYRDRDIERAGGIGLNVAVHARRLCAPGDTVTAVAPVGDDAGADLVRAAIARAGVQPCLEIVPGATPVQYIRHPRGGERVFERYDEGVLGGYRVSARQRRAIAASDVLATAAFGQGLAFFESVLACRPRGLRAVDFTNANDIGDPIAFAARWAPELDIGLFGLQASDTALIDALEEVARRSGRLFVVTLGADGSLALGQAGRTACAAQVVEQVVDTTGAGDAFTAGFLCEYARGSDVARSLARGTEVAASTLREIGSFELSARYTLPPS
jgi:fructoselysine 6-kinase